MEAINKETLPKVDLELKDSSLTLVQFNGTPLGLLYGATLQIGLGSLLPTLSLKEAVRNEALREIPRKGPGVPVNLTVNGGQPIVALLKVRGKYKTSKEGTSSKPLSKGTALSDEDTTFRTVF